MRIFTLEDWDKHEFKTDKSNHYELYTNKIFNEN